MDKLMEEEELKGLEEEIDNAVDRLFVERKKDREETFLMETPVIETSPETPEPEPSIVLPRFEAPKPESLAEPPLSLQPSAKFPPEEPIDSFVLEPSYELNEILDVEKHHAPTPVTPASPVSPAAAPSAATPPIPFLKSIEKMEAQLLSLEWEISGEKLEKTMEEILALKELLKQKTDMTSILNRMESLVGRMIRSEEDIRPAWIKFLLDSKETLKLLMRKETGTEIKQLAFLGIEARFSCLEGVKDSKISQPLPREGGVQVSGLSLPGEKKIEEMSKSVGSFMKRVEEIFGTIQQQIFKLEETSRKPFPEPPEARLGDLPVLHVTIFKIDERLFGVESEKVFKLFRVPGTFDEKYSDQEKIRLRDLEVKMIDLKKLLAIEEGERKEQIRVLTVKENEEYKGFMVDEVLKKVSILSERVGEADGYFSGVIPFNYQEQPLEIPILDLTKF